MNRFDLLQIITTRDTKPRTHPRTPSPPWTKSFRNTRATAASKYHAPTHKIAYISFTISTDFQLKFQVARQRVGETYTKTLYQKTKTLDTHMFFSTKCQGPVFHRRYSHFFSRFLHFHDSTRIHPFLPPNAPTMSRTKQIQPTKNVGGRAPQHPQHQHLASAVTVKTVPSAGYGVKKPHRWRPATMAVSALAPIPATLGLTVFLQSVFRKTVLRLSARH